ncbi:HlyD family efflux transporter periplasmic adaptor subunit [Actinosynnema sp. NPDC020468]|uniref:efflux RND transporter periplasmic adaptor subunit n=1 Tax=Actinosynnema sp. NPDC020468 TaxID=3154488 RepID=UPI0033C1317F
MRRSWIVNGLLVVVLVGVVVAGYLVFFGTGGSAESTQTRTAAAATRDVSEVVTASGEVQSFATATLNFATSGPVTELDVKVGDTVAKGQTLAKLDTRQLQLQVDIAQDNLDQAQLTLTNAEAKGTSTPQQESQVNQSTLALTQAQDNLAAATLTAPQDGTVTSLTGAVGQKAGSSSSSSSSGSGQSGSSSTGTGTTSSGFITLTDMKNLVLHANVAENDIGKLKLDQTAAVTVNALSAQALAGKVTQVDLLPTTSNNVVQYGVTVGLNSLPEGLRPGQSASVEITVAQATGVAVPSAAVTTTGTTNTVKVLENGQETTKTVQVGVRGDQYVQITDGLSDGEQVVLPQVTQSTTQAGTGQRQGTGNFPGVGGTGQGGTRGGGR